MILDDGGVATHVMVNRLYPLSQSNKLSVPAMNVNDSVIKTV